MLPTLSPVGIFMHSRMFESTILANIEGNEVKITRSSRHNAGTSVATANVNAS